MKKLKSIVFITLCTFFLLSLFSININASSNEIYIEGAQIRLNTPTGLRFVGKATKDFGEDATYGIVMSRGETTIDNLVVDGNANGYELAQCEVTELDSNNNFYITLTEIPSSLYDLSYSARAYVNINGEYTYSDTFISRSLLEVAKACYEDGNDSELIASIYGLYYPTTVNYNLNGGAWNDTSITTNYTSFEDMAADLLADFNLFKSKSYTKTTILEVSKWNADEVGFMYDLDTKAKWGWMIPYIAKVASTTNKPAYNVFFNYSSSSELNAANDNYKYEIVYELRAIMGCGQYTLNTGYITTDYSNVELQEEFLSYNRDNNKTQFTYTENQSSIKSPKKDFYTFEGWYSEPEFENKVTSFTAGDGAKILNLYAHYTPIDYTITYKLQGGVCSTTLVEECNINCDEIILPTADSMTITDGEFLGWYDNADATGSVITSIAAGTHENIELYACWIIAEPTDLTVNAADVTALNALEADIIVKSGLEAGKYILKGTSLDGEYSGIQYQYGTSAFATITDALAEADESDKIYVFAGTYSDAITIATANLTLYGPNYNINGNDTRNIEAIISGKIIISANGTCLNGINFTGTQILLSKTTLNNITLTCINSTGKGAGTTGGRTTVIASEGTTTITNLTITNNKIVISGGAGKNAIALYGKVSNLYINNNTFNNGGTAGGNSENVRTANLSGVVEFKNNNSIWSTANYLLMFAVKTCTKVDIIDNIVGPSTATTSGIQVSYLPANAVLTIEGNQINNMSGNIFNFSNSNENSIIKLNYNYFSTTTIFKTTTLGSSTSITLTNNWYCGGVDSNNVLSNDYDSEKDYTLEGYTSAYNIYKNGGN